MKIAAILTGKANSSFKNKNIKKINKKFIFLYPAVEAKKSKIINKFFTSSDSSMILKQTKKFGYESIQRPKSLARSSSKHVDVLIHAIKHMNKKKFYPDILVVLLANAPIIKIKWINECIKKLIKNPSATSIVPVEKNNDRHPLRAKKIKNNFLNSFYKSKNSVSTNRQDLEACYFLCHNFWVIRTKEILKNNGLPPWKFMGKKVLPYEVENSIDIHNNIDLEIARLIININNE